MPFSQQEFFAVFGDYNAAVWPAQVFLYLLALVAVASAWLRGGRTAVMVILGFLWLWAGIAYHFLFFARVNPAAWLFGALFVIEGGMLAWQGIAQRRTELVAPRGAYSWVGAALIAYALIGYPLLGLTADQALQRLPVLGVPCPTTILTFGLLFWLAPLWPRTLLVIPLLWTAIGSTAAVAFGVVQDFGLVAAGLVALWLLHRDSHSFGHLKSDAVIAEHAGHVT